MFAGYAGTTNGIISGNFMEFQSTPKLTYGHKRR